MDDSALIALKQEINATQDSEHDFAKWKLVVTAALGAAAFGLLGGSTNGTRSWVLLFIPFVCAYIDLYKYQYELRILMIARFLRSNAAGSGILQHYELEVAAYRGEHGGFSLGAFADIASSLGASILAAIFSILLGGTGLSMSRTAAAVIWSLGLIAIILVKVKFFRERRRIEEDKLPQLKVA